ncbi:COP9 signalosome complex subunit 6 [Penicillium odoratum]|uniref:COP9 signalosome complex subunit 6 n=1 Tax=Penicillium odoratum TaxID=1167516 RepID=UPI002548A240|nr:COP9 signalosome complex subunit 6 [Penicillium odoratum]KAJ5752082.1 COP9 signalosome complex subunit 6 [Penicillium odoratum]
MDTPSLVSQRRSESGLSIQLHPLVLLSISDHLTRHKARQRKGLVVGGLLGQQNGQEITLEHVFECPTQLGSDGDFRILKEWFDTRLQQCQYIIPRTSLLNYLSPYPVKDVHPHLELVGWWSTASPNGPNEAYLPIHRQILQYYNESAVFLAFHPSELQTYETHNAKLPLTIYESALENDNDNDNDAAKDMEIDGQDVPNLRFRELPYSMETGEAEMIGVNTIVQDSATAAVTSHNSHTSSAHPRKVDENENEFTPTKITDKIEDESAVGKLNHHEEQCKRRTKIPTLQTFHLFINFVYNSNMGIIWTVIASLTSRLNAVRILESRVTLVKSYVNSISANCSANPSESPAYSHPIIRNVNGLLSELSLLNPSDENGLAKELVCQNNDVLMVSLLGEVAKIARTARELGQKNAAVQTGRQTGSARKAAIGNFEDVRYMAKFEEIDHQYGPFSH